MGIHTGHRKRVKEKIEKSGFEPFADHEVLEALLFISVPYRDTNPIAHELIDKAGGLADVLRLSREEVTSVSGCGDYTATFLTLFSEMGRRSFTHTPAKDCYDSLDSLRTLAMDVIKDIHTESTYMLMLDNRFHLLDAIPVFHGYYASAAFRAPMVTEPALLAHASMVVLISRHVSRIARPDGFEMQTTRYLSEALDSVGVHLVEHFVAGGNICMPSINQTLPPESFSRPLGRFAEGGKLNVDK